MSLRLSHRTSQVIPVPNSQQVIVGGNIDIPGYYEVSGTPINNQFYPALNTSSFGVNAVSTWTLRTNPTNKEFRSIVWSPELGLFVTVSAAGTNDRVVVSPNGIDWSTRTTPADYFWRSICWSPEQGKFVAVSSTGTGNRCMTSTDASSWTLQTTPVDNEWTCVVWAKELSLYVAVAQSGTGDRVMTSSDGVTWVARSTPADNRWRGICWSPELSLFVAVAESGLGNRIMTSNDGITWQIRNSPADLDYQSVCWSSELALFVAVAGTGSTGRVITSPDGITWTLRTSILNYWNSVVWSPQLRLFVAVSQDGGSGRRVMYSADGVSWSTGVVQTTNPSLNNVCWSPELGIFVAVGDGGTATTRIVTSSLQGRPPTSFNVFDSSFNNINQIGLWNFQSFGRGAPFNSNVNFTVLPGQNWIDCSSAITITLPTASAWPGREITIRNIAANQILSNASNIVQADNTTINNIILNATARTWCTLVSNGTNWYKLQGNDL